MDWLPLLAGLVLVHGFLMIWCFTIMNNRVQLSLMTLDTTIAGAIAKVIEQGLPQIDPINPLQAALAQMLARSTAPESPPAIEVLRGDDGKFSG
jgi:hypothetical protein